MRLIAVALIGLLFLLLAAPQALAQNDAPLPAPGIAINSFDREATRIEAMIADRDTETDDLPAMLRTLTAQRDRIPPLKDRLEQEMAPLRQQLEALGPPPGEGMVEAESVAQERGALTGQLAEVEALSLRLDQADARAVALIDRVNDLRRQILTNRLTTRETSPLAPSMIRGALAGFADLASTLQRETARALEAESMAPGAVGLRLLGPFVVAIFIGVALAMARRALTDRLSGLVHDEMPASRRILVGIGLTASRLLLPALAVTVIALLFVQSGLLGPRGQALILSLAGAASIFVATFALATAFFAPRLPALRLSNLDDRCAASATRWSLVLAAVYGLDGPFAAEADTVDLAFESSTLANLVLLSFGGLALWRFERAIGRVQPATPVEPDNDPSENADAEPEERGVGISLIEIGRFLLLGVAVTAPVLAVAGYFAASRFIFYNPLATAALIGVFVLLFTVVRSAVESVMVNPAQGGAPTGAAQTGGTQTGGAQTASAQTVGAQGSDQVPSRRLRLIPVMVGFVLVCAAVPLIALIWGATSGDLLAGWQLVRTGVTVGDLRFQPLDFFVFIGVFAIIYLITNVIRLVLARSVLPVTGLDAGGRAAVTAGIGYLGVILAGLAAVTATGLDLSNLAIVAGALSVGIGFGLQTVVSNFVSGLILLIERPIKAGDWVQLASGMGYVKRIQVRATIIETFDRAALIVPNQELIGSTVINWTHNNLNGRIIVAVKVAMDADPREVERIMLEVARAHPMVLRRPQPFVLFRGYSDYAMLFEVRAVLRDVNWILNCQSDFYFEIHRRFAEAGIVIPVQQTRVALEHPALPTPGDPARDHPEDVAQAMNPAGVPDGDGDGAGIGDGGGDGR
ncbi:MAG: mechanosensitive ion channel domain-containing protein [Pseudomonadota bacterium]